MSETKDICPRIVPVILCGGSGTRLWPLSREGYPKQFVELEGGTLFRRTLERARALGGREKPIIVCNEKYRFYVANEMGESGMEAEIILEPAPRNTAPAAALAAFSMLGECAGEEPLMLLLPSDHHISDVESFCRIVLDAASLAEEGAIITFGIEPKAPLTGFGYIKTGEPLGKGFKIRAFVEKPDENRALELIRDGGCWNAGIFLLKPSVYLRELQKFSPDIFNSCQKAWQKRREKNGIARPGKNEFLDSPENSIDYAVMEHTDCAAVMPMAIEWDDMGSWEAFFRYAQKDDENNAAIGEVMLRDVKNSYVHSRGRMVAAIGVSDLAIVETGDAVLVSRRQDAQKVGEIVKSLKQAASPLCSHHPLVYRPWGSYEILARGERFQVKRIVVKPGASLSLQMHHHRAEHWIVVSGAAEVSLEGETKLYTENQSTYIPIGCRHRLRNPGIIPLIMIEIQSGSYLGEDDIVRFEDDYER